MRLPLRRVDAGVPQDLRYGVEVDAEADQDAGAAVPQIVATTMLQADYGHTLATGSIIERPNIPEAVRLRLWDDLALINALRVFPQCPVFKPPEIC
ncbi:hypothetical protein ACFX58_09950 [Sphingomonas sp. NCPPB 2930]